MAINKTTPRKGRAKKKVDDVEYTGVRIKYSQYTEVTRDADPEDEWDQDDLAHDVSIDGFEVVDKYPDILCPFKIDPDKTYYLVAATYSTGDSFHHETGLKSFVAMFQTEEEAKHACKLIRAHYNIYEYDNNNYFDKTKEIEKPAGYEEYGLVVPNNGVNMHVSSDWTGYFESLEAVDVYNVNALGVNLQYANNI